MSVTTRYDLKIVNGNIRDVLESSGIVKPGTITRKNRHEEDETRTFDSVLNYRACSKEFQDDFEKFNVKTGNHLFLPASATERISQCISKGFVVDSLESDSSCICLKKEWTDEELEELMKEPVSFSDDGKTMQWWINYGSNEAPGVAISMTFPDEIFEFTGTTEGRTDFSVYIKNNQDCTKDGTVYGSAFPNLSPKLVSETKDGWKVEIPFENNSLSLADDEFAWFSISKSEGFVTWDNQARPDGQFKRMCVLFNDKDPEVTVFNKDASQGATMKLSEVVESYREATRSFFNKQYGSEEPEVDEPEM